MPSACVGPLTIRRALAAAVLVLGADPAFASSAAVTDGLSVVQPDQQASTAHLIPETSWNDEAAVREHGDDATAGLSPKEVGDATTSLARRRPGMFSLPPPVLAASAGLVSGKTFASGAPVASGAVTSGFGMRRHPLLGILRPHAGVDLAAPAGSPVVATAEGRVSTAGWTGGFGLLVAVEHGRGRQTRYAHLSRLNVTAGQRVRHGDVIGYVGSTGRSTGPHLHYETRVNGRAINPRR